MFIIVSFWPCENQVHSNWPLVSASDLPLYCHQLLTQPKLSDDLDGNCGSCLRSTRLHPIVQMWKLVGMVTGFETQLGSQDRNSLNVNSP
jgi:hypothetical protein